MQLLSDRVRKKTRMFRWHHIAGIIAAFFLIILGVTGSILAFQKEIDRTLNPSVLIVKPGQHRVPLNDLVKAAQEHYPQYKARDIWMPEAEDDALTVGMSKTGVREGVAVFLDPYTGRVLGDSEHTNNFTDYVRDLHTSLLMGGFGDVLVWLSAVLMVSLCFTGMTLWWKRRRYVPVAGTPVGVFRLDLHSSLGLYLCAILFVFAWTAIRPIPVGLFIDFRKEMAVAQLKAPPDATPLPLEQLLQIAEKTLPGAKIVRFSIPEKSSGAMPIFLRFPDDHSHSGKSVVVLKPYNGEVAHVLDPRNLSLLGRYAFQWNMDIHMGAIFGLPSRIFASIASLVLTLLAITGLRLWLLRRHQED